MPVLKYYKQDSFAFDPVYATLNSACFDLKARLVDGEIINGLSAANLPIRIKVKDQSINIYPSDRLMIPTGLIFDIPEGYCMKLYPRSGLSLKNGLNLANCVGIVDSDYVEPVFILATNISEVVINIKHGDRICQAELIPILQTEFMELKERPSQKTDRAGGFGSTGR